MSGLIEVTQPNTSYTLDSTIFEVQSGASLNLTGSSDEVILDNGAGSLSISGTGDTVIATTVSGASVRIYGGSGNTVSVGANSVVGDWWGDSDTITAGSNSNVYTYGTNVTINATQGGDTIEEYNGSQGNEVDTLNANNDTISLVAGNTAINGNANQVTLTPPTNGGLTTVNVTGSNNAFSASAAPNPNGSAPDWTISTRAASVAEANGVIVLTGGASASSVSNNAVTVQLSDGNVATLSNVASGTTLEYVDASGTVTTTSIMDPTLVHLGGNLYEATANNLVDMNNAIFEVQSGASLNLTGSSDEVILNSGAGNVSINGTGDTVIGSSVSNANITIWGAAANTVSVGANSTVIDWGENDSVTTGAGSSVVDWANGETSTVGANSKVTLDGTNVTVNATQGGCTIGEHYTVASGGFGVSATLNANSDSIGLQVGDSTINGSGNQISLDTSEDYYNGIGSTINLNGGNNTISFDANATNTGPITIQTKDEDYVEEDASGAIWFTSASFSIANGVVTLGFSDGNKVVISDVRSSAGTSLEANNQVGQLVSAMASYSSAPGGTASVPVTLASTESLLLASAHQ